MGLDGKNLVEGMASKLLEAMTKGGKVDKETLDLAVNIIETHQLYIQLLYVGMVVERINQLQRDFATQDELIEEIDIHDLAEADPTVKARMVAVLNQSIKTKVDVINNMIASRDAVGLLISGLRETFGGGIEDHTGAEKDMLTKFAELPPSKRQDMLGGIINQVVKAAMTNEEAVDVEFDEE